MLVPLSFALIAITFAVACFALRSEMGRSLYSVIVPIFFACYLVLGSMASRGYGVSIDEESNRRHGMVAVKHVLRVISPSTAESLFPKVPALAHYRYRYYGVAFQMPLVAAERLIPELSDRRLLWQFRHLCTFLLFYLGVLALYCLVREQSDWRLGLLAVSLLVTTPRIFSEAFYNDKDAVFFAAFTIALYFGLRFWRSPGIWSALFFGGAVAYASNIRIVGVFLIPSVIVMSISELLLEKRPAPIQFRRLIWLGTAMFFAFIVVILATAPVSWTSPTTYISDTLQSFANYKLWRGFVMFMGHEISGDSVPWYYVPVSMLITIPPAIVITFMVGVGAMLWDLKRVGMSCLLRRDYRESSIMLLLIVLPIAAAVYKHSTLYNGWRHFTFVYTPFLLVSMFGVRSIIGALRERSKRTFLFLPIGPAVCLICLALLQLGTVRWMVMSHPFHIAYFNPLTVPIFGGRGNFERDYMRSTNLWALKRIMKEKRRGKVSVSVSDGWRSSIDSNAQMLPSSERASLVSVESPFKADYIIHNYRQASRRFSARARELAMVDTLAPDGIDISTIFRYADLEKGLLVRGEDGRALLRIDTYPFLEYTKKPDSNNRLAKGARHRRSKLYVRVPWKSLSELSDNLRMSMRYSLINSKPEHVKVKCPPFRPTAPRVDRLGLLEFDLHVSPLKKSGQLNCVISIDREIDVESVDINPLG